MLAILDGTVMRRRRGADPRHRRRACCAATASSRSCASTAAGRSRSTSTSTRMRRSAANLRLPIDVDAVRADVEALLERNGEPDAALRVVVTRGGRRLAVVEQLKPLPDDARPGHGRATRRRACSTASSRCPTRANMLARRLAQEQGADEALLVTPHGRVLEGPTSSFFCSLDGETLVTPPLERPHPRLDHAPAPARAHRRDASRSSPLDELARVREAFLASTMREVQPVARDRRRRAAGGARAAHRRPPRAGIRAHIEQELGVVRLTACGSSPSSGTGRSSSRPRPSRACCAREHDELLVHTGQHYDDELSTVFVARARRAAARARARHPRRHEHRADRAHARRARPAAGRASAPTSCSSTATRTRRSPAALAAAQARVPVAHVEAGMRSFDRAMPEELNRVLTDHLADLLLCPSPTAVANLEREGVAGRVELVGDVMVDVALLVPAARARRRRAAARGRACSAGELRARHRAPRRQRRRPGAPAGARRPAARRCRCRSSCPLHPRTRARLRGRRAGSTSSSGAAHVRLRPPLGYLDFTALLCARARGADRLRRRAEGGLPRRACRA